MNLIIAAYWTDDDAQEATRIAAEAIHGHLIPGTGSVVSLAEHSVDAGLRAFLRNLQLEEAADS